MTDFTHHTPRLLSEADAAADLAGVARPVSLPEPSFRLVWLADRGVYKVNKPNIDTTDCYTPDVVRTLVSERDALASRVRELEAALSDLLDNVAEPPDANCSCHISPPCHDCVEYGEPREVFANARAALTNTPESKP